jgi:hypothetical protein
VVDQWLVSGVMVQGSQVNGDMQVGFHSVNAVALKRLLCSSLMMSHSCSSGGVLPLKRPDTG